MGSLMETHEFAEQRGLTAMRITPIYALKEARDGAIASGMDQDMEAGYKQLDGLLVQSGRPGRPVWTERGCSFPSAWGNIPAPMAEI
jgi:hypothetical protein